MIASSEDRDLYRAPLLPWLFPTKAAAAQAWKIADKGHLQEQERSGASLDYTDPMVRVAVVHARQDVAATFVIQIALHRQLVNISRGVWWLGLWIAFLIASRVSI